MKLRKSSRYSCVAFHILEVPVVVEDLVSCSDGPSCTLLFHIK